MIPDPFRVWAFVESEEIQSAKPVDIFLSSFIRLSSLSSVRYSFLDSLSSKNPLYLCAWGLVDLWSLLFYCLLFVGRWLTSILLFWHSLARACLCRAIVGRGGVIIYSWSVRHHLLFWHTSVSLARACLCMAIVGRGRVIIYSWCVRHHLLFWHTPVSLARACLCMSIVLGEDESSPIVLGEDGS